MDSMPLRKFEWNNYEEELNRIGPTPRHIRRILKRYLERIEFDSIVDVGCGTGSFLESLNLEGKRVAGIDISTEAIKTCRDKFGKKWQFDVFDIESASPEKKYDVAVCSDTLEHIKNDVKALKNIRKLCSRLIISVPAGKYMEDDRLVGHYRRYSKRELISKLRKAGFSIHKAEYWGFPFYSPIYRSIINRVKVNEKVNFMTRILAELIYFSFFLNIKDRGDRIFVLAE